MQCSDVRELLSPMTDREVSPEELRAIEEHLRSCKDCAFESTMIVGLKGLLQKWEGVRASAAFHARVLEKVRSDPAQLPRHPWWAALAIAVAIGCLAVGVAWMELGAPEGAMKVAAPADQAGKPPEAAGPAPAAPDTTPGTQAGPVAQLILTEGAVHIDVPGSTSALGSAGDVLLPGYVVRVSERGRAELDLLGSLFMRLEGPARYVFGPVCSEGELLAGTALLRAGVRGVRNKIRCGGAAVEFETAGLLASLARGADGGLRVLVAEGSAEVSSASGSRTLRAGEKLELSRDGSLRTGPAKAEPAELDRLRRWGRP